MLGPLGPLVSWVTVLSFWLDGWAWLGFHLSSLLLPDAISSPCMLLLGMLARVLVLGLLICGREQSVEGKTGWFGILEFGSREERCRYDVSFWRAQRDVVNRVNECAPEWEQVRLCECR
jgi:hypothetical protein